MAGQKGAPTCFPAICRMSGVCSAQGLSSSLPPQPSHAPAGGCDYEDQTLVQSRLIVQPCFSKQQEVLLFMTSESPYSLSSQSISLGLVLQALGGLCLRDPQPSVDPLCLPRVEAPGLTVTRVGRTLPLASFSDHCTFPRC